MKVKILSLCLVVFVLTSICCGEKIAPVHIVGTNTYLRNWLICGAFPNRPIKDTTNTVNRAGYDTDFLEAAGGEAAYIPSLDDQVLYEGEKYRFRLWGPEKRKLDIRTLYDDTYKAAYLFTWLESESDQVAFFHLGSDDGVKVYVNGEQIHTFFGDRGAREHDDIFMAHLHKGRNPLMIKIEQGIGGWSLVMEIMERREHFAYIQESFDRYIKCSVKQAGSIGEEITIGLSAGELVGNTKVIWTVSDENGQVIESAEGSSTSETGFSLPEKAGFYHITAELPEMGIQRVYTCLLHENPKGVAEELSGQAVKLINDPKYEPYAGWLEYLRWKFMHHVETKTFTDTTTIKYMQTLRDWIDKVKIDPLPAIRGGFEWAYQSKADQSGQPFSILIPDNYDPGKAYPLHIRLHGKGGTHRPDLVEGQSHDFETINVNVMGRARGGGYVKLSEVDVLEVLDYVQQHWNVDPDRVHISGGSMGGGGTFRLATRHPHLFASAIPKCGYAAHIYFDGLLNVPVFSVHSDDDWIVPIVNSRVPLIKLSEMGGNVIRYESTGHGHAPAVYTEDLAMYEAWTPRQVRRTDVERIKYIATDKLSARSYWSEIMEWGPLSTPASVHVRAGRNNSLSIDTDNVNILKLDLQTAPLDLTQPLYVTVNTVLLGVISNDIPEHLYIVAQEDGHAFSAVGPGDPSVRRHFPGGMAALYHGEPLLIVYGTTADEEMNKALREGARLASQSSNPAWYDEKADFPMNEMLYGRIPVKADTEVTEEDLQSKNLILIGSPAANSIVARIAGQLPVTIEKGQVATDDGITYSLEGRMMGLHYYNPLAPQRLIYIIISDELDFYEAGVKSMEAKCWDPSDYDFSIYPINNYEVVAGRNVQSDWSWENGYLESELLPANICTNNEAYARFISHALRHTTAADFLLRGIRLDEAPFSIGEARWMDMTSHPMRQRILAFRIRGDLFKKHLEIIDNLGVDGYGRVLRIFPATDPDDINPDQYYQISAIVPWDISDYAKAVKWNPEKTILYDFSWQDAVKRYRKTE